MDEFKNDLFYFLIFTFIGFNLPSTSFGNSQHLEIPTSSLKVSPEINEFQKHRNLRTRTDDFEVVGRPNRIERKRDHKKLKKFFFT